MKKQKTSSIEWNQVTSLSKVLAAILFVALPFIAFFWGMTFQQKIDEPLVATVNEAVNTTVKPVTKTLTPKTQPKTVTTKPIQTNH
jgi:hypothetical protein